jgi:hypothetical protein
VTIFSEQMVLGYTIDLVEVCVFYAILEVSEQVSEEVEMGKLG